MLTVSNCSKHNGNSKGAEGVSRMPTVYDSSVYTPLSNHAKGWPDDYAKVAEAGNLAGICFTDHAPLSESFTSTRMNSARDNIDLRGFMEYFSLLNETKAQYEGKLDIRLGMEIDYIPLDIKHVKNLIEKASSAGLDYVLGGAHCLRKEFIEDYFRETILEGQRKYYRQMAEAAQTGLFNCIAHPDLIKDRYEYEYWDPEKLEREIDEFLDVLNETGTCMEVNTAGFDLDCADACFVPRIVGEQPRPPQMFPCDYILERAQQKDVSIVLGSAAHNSENVGSNFKKALEKLSEIGFKNVHIGVEGKKGESYLIEDGLNSLSYSSKIRS